MSCAYRTLGGFSLTVSINGTEVGRNNYVNPSEIEAIRRVRYYVFARPGINTLTASDTDPKVSPPSKTIVFYYNPSLNQVLPEKNPGDPDECPLPENGTNPINSGTGNKYHQETDYRGTGSFPREFKRYYNSPSPMSGLSSMWDIWNRWRTSFDRTLRPVGAEILHAKRPDGKLYIFTKDGQGVWQAEADVRDRVEELPGGGWEYIQPDATIETYDSAGTL